MDITKFILLENSIQSWLAALLVLLGVTAALSLLKYLILRRATSRQDRDDGQITQLLIRLVRRTHVVFILFAALNIGLAWLALPEETLNGVQLISFIVLMIQIGLWSIGIINYSVVRYTQQRVQEDAASVTAISALSIVAKGALWIIIFLLILENMGVEVGTLIAGLGIGGIAVALAVQNILGDLFASFTIVMDQPLVIGDTIIIDEHIGTVEYIGMKSTRIRSLNGEQMIFSNSDLLNSRIRNFKRMERRRMLFTLNLTYQTAIDKLSRIPTMLQEIIEAQELATFDRSHFKAFGPSSLDFETVYFLESPEYKALMDIQQKINLAVLERFAAEGIEFAYPTQTVFLEQGAGAL